MQQAKNLQRFLLILWATWTTINIKIFNKYESIKGG